MSLLSIFADLQRQIPGHTAVWAVGGLVNGWLLSAAGRRFLRTLPALRLRWGRPRKGRSLLLDLFTSAKFAKDAQIVLSEQLPIWAEEHGWGWAKVIYFSEELRMIWGQYATWILTLVKAIIKAVTAP